MDNALSFIYAGDKLGIYGQGDTARRLREVAQRDWDETVRKPAETIEKEISDMLDHPFVTFDLKTHQFFHTKLLPDPCFGFPLRRDGRSFSIFQNCLYLVGGRNRDVVDYGNEYTMSSEIWRLDLDTHRWNKTLLQLDTPVSHCSTAVSPDGFIYVFGGRTSTCIPRSNDDAEPYYWKIEHVNIVQRLRVSTQTLRRIAAEQLVQVLLDLKKDALDTTQLRMSDPIGVVLGIFKRCFAHTYWTL
uniref:Kelch repeat protein n=1 Tax=Ditylenchus dipsaci TaxID=166011 RepID=A0A915DA27_9BILA